MHLLHDIASTHEISFDVNLGNSWPIGVVLDGLPDTLIFEHIHVFELFHSVEFKNLHHVIRKSASWHFSGSLHEEADVVGADPL